MPKMPAKTPATARGEKGPIEEGTVDMVLKLGLNGMRRGGADKLAGSVL